MITISKRKIIHTITFTLITIAVYSQQFEGVITYRQVETNNSILRTLVELQQRPGPIERYLNKQIKVYIAGDTLICERYDSLGILINTSLQIGDNIYSRLNYGEQVFKNFSHYPPSISLINNWKQVKSFRKSIMVDSLIYYIGSENSNPNQITEIGVETKLDTDNNYTKNGLFRYFFFKDGWIYHESLKYKDHIATKSNYHYKKKEVSLLCKKKIAEYYIQY